MGSNRQTIFMGKLCNSFLNPVVHALIGFDEVIVQAYRPGQFHFNLRRRRKCVVLPIKNTISFQDGGIETTRHKMHNFVIGMVIHAQGWSVEYTGGKEPCNGREGWKQMGAKVCVGVGG